MSSPRGKILGYVVGVGSLGAILWYLSTQQDLMEQLRRLSWSSFALLILVGVAGALNVGGRFRLTCGVFDVRVRYWEGVGLAMTNSMLNYAIPLKGGLLFRAAYMKQTYGLSYTDYVAMLASSQVLSVAAAGVGGLALSGASATVHGVVSGGLVVTFALSVILACTVFVVADRVRFGRLKASWLASRLEAFSLGFARWLRQPWQSVRFLASAGVAVGLASIRLVIIFAALGIDAPVLVIALIAAAVWLSGTLPITPGNLGVTESVTTLAAGLLGIDPRLALLAAVIDRAASLVVIFGTGLPFSHMLVVRRTRRSDNQDATTQ